MSSLSVTTRERFLLWPGLRWWGERRRFSTQGGFLWVLAIALEKGEPLLPVVETFSQEAPGLWKFRLERLAAHLNAGLSLPEALQKVPELLPAEGRLSIQAGWENGRAVDGLKQAALQYARTEMGVGVSANRFFRYLQMVAIAAFCVVGFVNYYIIPKFKAIMNDFGMELPQSTVNMLSVCDFFSSFMPLIALMLLVGILYRWITGIRGADVWVRILSPRDGVAGVLRNLRLAVLAKEPLLPTVSLMQKAHPIRRIRRRLSAVKKWMEQGGTCWVAMQQNGLLNPQETALLDSAERVGNLEWTLDEMSEILDQRSDYVARRRLELIRPAVILLLGVTVGYYVVAMFYPLLAIINALR